MTGVQTCALPIFKYSLPTITAAERQRMNEVTPQRYNPTWKERVIGAFKPDYTKLRQKFLNRYETLAKYDRALREMIKKSGGPDLLADQSAEFAALQSDQAAGVAAAALGMMLTTAISAIRSCGLNIAPICIMIVTFILIGIVHMSLVTVVLIMTPISVLLSWPRTTKASEGKPDA